MCQGPNDQTSKHKEISCFCHPGRQSWQMGRCPWESRCELKKRAGGALLRVKALQPASAQISPGVDCAVFLGNLLGERQLGSQGPSHPVTDQILRLNLFKISAFPFSRGGSSELTCAHHPRLLQPPNVPRWLGILKMYWLHHFMSE